MSEENITVKILNLYAMWYHKEMLDETRENPPILNEFLEVQIKDGNIADLFNSIPELKGIAKALEL
tara:strand:- start:3000 stop:3197 length:198 start_codon:yes stop_codon:yes gene_type:complete